jgi:3-phosphoshikimate 1-carboxyvinyltransferase
LKSTANDLFGDDVKGFYFKGIIPASKSLMNRALIAQSYQPRLKLRGESRCEDVVHLKKSLKKLKSGSTFDCGDGGTTFRFLAFRVSRLPGTYLLTGSPRLRQRPQNEIKEILTQLGVQVLFEKKGMRIISRGWQQPSKPVKVDAKNSSQFLSALFLNSWELDFNLEVKVLGKITSESYFQMTTKMLKSLGLRYRVRGKTYIIARDQKLRPQSYRLESDLSSLFSVACFAALSGEAQFLEFPKKSLQPDGAFLKLFKKMGIPVLKKKNRREIRASSSLTALKANLKNCPDLFPVLATLCAFAEGRSVLFGAPQLVKKESNRIEKTAELLTKAGFDCQSRNDGLEIMGGGYQVPVKSFSFDPDSDHRLAMAAALLKSQGFKIKIKNPKVVNKSFPEFWKCVGVRP